MSLGGARGVGSGPTWEGAGHDSDAFPVGLRVLVVDDDPTCLKILERMLVTCRYEVTKCSRVDYALNELRNNKKGFDVVISDVHMPNLDGFKLLEYVGLEMDLPVIMMSADDSKKVVMKGVKHGACDYMTKPVRMDALKNIWQHVVRKKKNNRPDPEPLGQRQDADGENWRSSKRKGDDEEADDYGGFKKQRVVWSIELHQQFVAAVNQLGIDKAVPKKILELMNVPGLTRENVASHLQKYRLCLRKLSGEPYYFEDMSAPSTAFATMASLGGYQLPRLPVDTSLALPLGQTNAFGLPELRLRNSNQQSSYLLHGNSAAPETRRPPSFYRPLLSSGELVGAFPRDCLPENIQSRPYTSRVNHVTELSPLIQEDPNLTKKRSRGFDAQYDLLNQLAQQHPQAWLHNTNAASTSVLVNQNLGYSTSSTNGNNHALSAGRVLNIQSGNNLDGENAASRLKPAEEAQEASSASNHYHFEFDHDDLLTTMLNQQEVTGEIEREFDFAALDDIFLD